MEEIFADSELTAKHIKQTIEALFPAVQLFEWNPRGGDVEPIGFDLGHPAHRLFDIYQEPKRVEFQWQISIYRMSSQGEEERSQLIAQTLSASHAVRTLVTFQKPDMPDCPYYDLVYTDGVCYLADDSMFDWGGDENWPDRIRILYPYVRPIAQFDEYGNLISSP